MSAATGAKPPGALSMDEVRSIVDRSKEGISEEEREVLSSVVESYGALLSAIRDKDATIAKLRSMLFGAKTESKENVQKKTGARTPPASKNDARKERGDAAPKRKGHGRLPVEAYIGATKVEIPHESLKPGDPCPEPGCQGTVYEQEPIVFVRVCGCAPFGATVYKRGRLRCGLCGRTFAAKLPDDVKDDQKFDESVTSMLGMLRYGYGLPMNRIEDLQGSTGVPFPASTQWDLLEDGAKDLEPVRDELVRVAAQGSVVMNDDTVMQILAHKVEENGRKDRGEPSPERTGIFTSGIVSEVEAGRKVVLYFTGKRHAGENLARVLAERGAERGPPIQMCDGLERNAPDEIRTILSNCLVHARRQFVDVASGFPAEVDHVIDEIALVYKHEIESRGLTPPERLRLHQEKSGPVMARLKSWMEAQLDEKNVEPNSGLGKAIRYSLKRWERLTVFLERPGAPLDNSLTERILKRAIRHRRNSLFYKTENGAQVGDLYMSLIATAKLAGADPLHYLTELLRHAEDLGDRAAAWMPWNYLKTLANPAPPD